MDCPVVNAAAEALRGKVPVGLRVPLQGHQDLGQAAPEQFPVEKVVGLLEALIFGDGNGSWLLHICIVLHNFSVSILCVPFYKGVLPAPRSQGAEGI